MTDMLTAARWKAFTHLQSGDQGALNIAIDANPHNPLPKGEFRHPSSLSGAFTSKYLISSKSTI